MKFIFNFSLFFSLLLLQFIAYGQGEHAITVTGQIIDAQTNDPLIGVTVQIKDTYRGTVTDRDGNFSISIPSETQTLVINYLGYLTKELVVSGTSTPIDLNKIAMEPNISELEEVRISAQRQFFGNMEKGRSIQKISSEEIALETSGNISDLLQTRLSGVWAAKTSGAPGDHMKIRIRGMSSLFASDDPLYVVDGVQIPNINLKSLGVAHLNINDIENITVLKDISSTALYGFQGGNGVVIIDTRRGTNDPQISFMTRLGMQQFTNYYPMMNTHDFIESLESSRDINNTTLRYQYPAYSDSLESIDWQDEVFQTGVVQEYQLAGGGSAGKTNYYISGNYLTHKGIVRASQYNKYSLAANLGRTIAKRFKMELSVKYSLQENINNLDSYLGNDLLLTGIHKPPCLNNIDQSVLNYTQDDFPILSNYANWQPLEAIYTPDTYLNNSNKELDILHFSSNLFLNYRISDFLNFNFSASLSRRKQYYELATNEFAAYTNKYYLSSDENYIVFNHQYNLTYSRSFGYHSLKAVGGIKSYTDNVYWEVDSLNYPYKQYGVAFETGSALSQGTLAILGVEGAVVRTINSYVGHLNYDYRKRYNLSFALNYDHLSEGNYVQQGEFFPSVALNWRLNQEPWFSIGVIDNLNLYINYGKAGNYPLNALSNDLYIAKEYSYPTETGEGYVIDQLANHNLEAEIVREVNLGTELSILKHTLSFKADLFRKINSGLIMKRDIPAHYGGGKLFINVGEIESQGIDLGIQAQIIRRTHFSWQAQLNVSTIQQKINALDNEDTLVFESIDLLYPEFRINKAGKLGDIYGYAYLGKSTDQDNQQNNAYVVSRNGLYLNADSSDNRLSSDDYVVIGNSIPKYTANFNTSFRIKNFSVDMLWYGVFGIEKYNGTRAAGYAAGTNPDINQLINDTLGIYTRNEFYQSSFFVEDASFIRLKNLTIAYHLPKKIFSRVETQISLSFDNLLTFSNYSGYDPEAAIYTDNTFSDNAVDRGAYPIPRSVYLTINLRL